MSRLLILALALLSCFAAPARAYDIFPEIFGYAFFINADDTKTELINPGAVVTPGGGRAFDSHEFGNKGLLCTQYTGQVDWLCASTSGSVDIDRELVETTTYIGIRTSARLKAQVHVDYRNANATTAVIRAQAKLTIPIACHGGVVPTGGGLSVLYRLDGEYSVSVSDPALTLTAPRPFEDCTAGEVCKINLPMFPCPDSDSGSVAFLTIDLHARIQVDNLVGHQGWSLQGVSDYSHTFTLEGIDAVDDQGHPLPDIRVVVPGDGGAINDYFLTGAEAAEVAANSTTTTTTIDATITTTTTSSGATTSTTTPSCATGDLAAASCRCAQRPAAGCEGVTLPKPVDKGVSGLCAKIAKTTAASGKKQRRFAKQAVAIARKTLHTVDGRKGTAIPDACREGLRGFLQATQTDAGTATH